MHRVSYEQIPQWVSTTNYGENLSRAIISTCPYCAHNFVPFAITWYIVRKHDNSGFLQSHIHGAGDCTVCGKRIFALHVSAQQTDYMDIPKGVYMLPEPPVGVSFSQLIKDFSPDFVSIYQQAAQAEADGLDQVAGPGYRKSLEFLVKDYLISIGTGDQSAKEEIANRGLHRCITDIGNKKLQAAANAAKLAGNDESHYVKFQGRNIDDLKRFIYITVNWLEVELETQALIDSRAP